MNAEEDEKFRDLCYQGEVQALTEILQKWEEKGVLNERINAQDPLFGRTALMVAVMHNQPEVVQLLVSYGADLEIVDAVNSTNVTPRNALAFAEGNQAIMNILRPPGIVQPPGQGQQRVNPPAVVEVQPELNPPRDAERVFQQHPRSAPPIPEAFVFEESPMMAEDVDTGKKDLQVELDQELTSLLSILDQASHGVATISQEVVDQIAGGRKKIQKLSEQIHRENASVASVGRTVPAPDYSVEYADDISALTESTAVQYGKPSVHKKLSRVMQEHEESDLHNPEILEGLRIQILGIIYPNRQEYTPPSEHENTNQQYSRGQGYGDQRAYDNRYPRGNEHTAPREHEFRGQRGQEYGDQRGQGYGDQSVYDHRYQRGYEHTAPTEHENTNQQYSRGQEYGDQRAYDYRYQRGYEHTAPTEHENTNQQYSRGQEYGDQSAYDYRYQRGYEHTAPRGHGFRGPRGHGFRGPRDYAYGVPGRYAYGDQGWYANGNQGGPGVNPYSAGNQPNPQGSVPHPGNLANSPGNQLNPPDTPSNRPPGH